MVYTSVTTMREGTFTSKAGKFDYRHIKEALFWGYNSVTLNKQTAFIASPEKALLDFFYLNRIKISLEYLEELRLQNLDQGKRDAQFRNIYSLPVPEFEECRY